MFLKGLDLLGTFEFPHVLDDLFDNIIPMIVLEDGDKLGGLGSCNLDRGWGCGSSRSRGVLKWA
jgi:hypothetical protein